MDRGAIAEINLSAIAYNLKIVNRSVKERPVIAVVKADAYGHGSLEVSKRLIQEGVSFLAVAYTGEAIHLRDAGITAPIIVLFDCEDIHNFFDFDFVPVIHTSTAASALSQEAKKRGTTIKVHVKVDTGMGRLGLHGKHVIKDIMNIAGMDGIELAGLMSHFSDADLSDTSFAAIQLKAFNVIRDTLYKKLNRKIFSHMANSAAVINFEDAHIDAVRPGLMLYGYSPLAQNTPSLTLPPRGGRGWRGDSGLLTKTPEPITVMPAMRVRTKILCIRSLSPDSPVSYGRTFVTKRKSTIGVIPLGYADGYNRLFSNNGVVLVRGNRVPVVGRVCMDLTMVDLTEIRDAKEGDEVIVLGQQGNETITAYELAQKAQTIPYEILTSMGSHSKKEYIHNSLHNESTGSII
ncbi:MAG TPA: alanine racemase [Thermodesulfovibrionales bacterium]|nr:alanine racemase [Thermodesulfovibrionales bacterium]